MDMLHLLCEVFSPRSYVQWWFCQSVTDVTFSLSCFSSLCSCWWTLTPMLLLTLFTSRYFSQATRPAHPTCAFVCKELPLEWPSSLYLCLWCCSALAAVATPSCLRVNLDIQTIFLFPSLQWLLLCPPRSARFKSNGQYFQVMLPGAVVSAFFNLLATNTLCPLPAYPLQGYHTVHLNGDLRDEPSLESSGKTLCHAHYHMTTPKLQSGCRSISLWYSWLWS